MWLHYLYLMENFYDREVVCSRSLCANGFSNTVILSPVVFVSVGQGSAAGHVLVHCSLKQVWRGEFDVVTLNSHLINHKKF